MPSATAAASAPKTFDNVVLITVDALRADQPWAGYTYGNTPNLDAFASHAVQFTRAYSLANHTTPSLAGMLSGRYPSELTHDRCSLTFYKFTNGLASALSEGGIHTFAAHGHAIFVGNQRPSNGFQEWKVIDKAAAMLATEGAVTGALVAKLLNDFLQSQTVGGSRFFAWAHFLDPHDAYVTHEAFPASAHPRRGAYDGEVAYEDSVVGAVLDTLRRTGLAQRTAVVFTADHGEAFGEHGYTRHGYTAFDEEVHVPLMIAGRGLKPRRIDVVRSAIDIAPTIAELLGVQPLAQWRGHSLLADLRTNEPEQRRALIDAPEVDFRVAIQAVVSETTKVILQGSTRRIYDLVNDPEEKQPKSPKEMPEAAEEATALLSRLESIPSTPCALTGK